MFLSRDVNTFLLKSRKNEFISLFGWSHDSFWPTEIHSEGHRAFYNNTICSSGGLFHRFTRNFSPERLLQPIISLSIYRHILGHWTFVLRNIVVLNDLNLEGICITNDRLTQEWKCIVLVLHIEKTTAMNCCFSYFCFTFRRSHDNYYYVTFWVVFLIPRTTAKEWNSLSLSLFLVVTVCGPCLLYVKAVNI